MSLPETLCNSVSYTLFVGKERCNLSLGTRSTTRHLTCTIPKRSVIQQCPCSTDTSSENAHVYCEQWFLEHTKDYDAAAKHTRAFDRTASRRLLSAGTAACKHFVLFLEHFSYYSAARSDSWRHGRAVACFSRRSASRSS